MGSTNSLFDCSQFAMASIAYYMDVSNGTDDEQIEQNVTVLRPIRVNHNAVIATDKQFK